jgi:hypothetical protein
MSVFTMAVVPGVRVRSSDTSYYDANGNYLQRFRNDSQFAALHLALCWFFSLSADVYSLTEF